ncbi:MAG: hypothetical protein ABSB15_28685 [Bryobacteraceae bacterium]
MAEHRRTCILCRLIRRIVVSDHPRARVAFLRRIARILRGDRTGQGCTALIAAFLRFPILFFLFFGPGFLLGVRILFFAEGIEFPNLFLALFQRRRGRQTIVLADAIFRLVR